MLITKRKAKNDFWFNFPLYYTAHTVAPTHVSISGPSEARVGDPVPLQCTTAPSNPPAEIKWMVSGRQVRNATSRTLVSPEGNIISSVFYSSWKPFVVGSGNFTSRYLTSLFIIIVYCTACFFYLREYKYTHPLTIM